MPITVAYGPDPGALAQASLLTGNEQYRRYREALALQQQQLRQQWEMQTRSLSQADRSQQRSLLANMQQANVELAARQAESRAGRDQQMALATMGQDFQQQLEAERFARSQQGADLAVQRENAQEERQYSIAQQREFARIQEARQRIRSNQSLSPADRAEAERQLSLMEAGIRAAPSPPLQKSQTLDQVIQEQTQFDPERNGFWRMNDKGGVDFVELSDVDRVEALRYKRDQANQEAERTAANYKLREEARQAHQAEVAKMAMNLMKLPDPSSPLGTGMRYKTPAEARQAAEELVGPFTFTEFSPQQPQAVPPPGVGASATAAPAALSPELSPSYAARKALVKAGEYGPWHDKIEAALAAVTKAKQSNDAGGVFQAQGELRQVIEAMTAAAENPGMNSPQLPPAPVAPPASAPAATAPPASRQPALRAAPGKVPPMEHFWFVMDIGRAIAELPSDEAKLRSQELKAAFARLVGTEPGTDAYAAALHDIEDMGTLLGVRAPKIYR